MFAPMFDVCCLFSAVKVKSAGTTRVETGKSIEEIVLKKATQGKWEIFVVVYFTFPFILRPLTINTNHKPTFELMKLRTGVAPPPSL